jgi:AP-1 complex subunit mu
MYIKHQNLYVVAASKKNANAALVFVFLHRLVQVSSYRDSATAAVG